MDRKLIFRNIRKKCSQAPVEGKGKLGAGFLLFSLALLATFVVLALVLMGIL